MKDFTINIDPIYNSKKVMVQINDLKQEKTHILSNSFLTLDSALKEALEFINTG